MKQENNKNFQLISPWSTHILVITNLLQLMCYENIMTWKKKEQNLKLLWYTLYKNGWYKQKNAWKNGVDNSNNE